MHKGHAFELRYEGPVDDSPETIRNLKAAFLVDLNLPMERVQEIMAATPTTVLTSDSKMEVEALLELIKHAGGRVALVQTIPETVDSFELTFETDDEEPIQTNEEEDLFDPGIKTYELSEQDADTEELIPELLVKQTVGPVAQIEESKLMLSADDLTLGEPVESSELIESPAKALGVEELLKEPDPLPTPTHVEEAEFVEHKSTAVEMVLQGLNKEITFSTQTDESVSEKTVTEPPAQVAQPSKPLTTDSMLTFENEETPPVAAAQVSSSPVPVTSVEVVVDAPAPKSEPIQKTPAQNRPTPQLKATPKTVIPPKQVTQPKTEPEKKHSAAMDLVLPILIGIPLLLAGNWYFMTQNTTPNNQQSLEQAVRSLAVNQKQASETDVEKKEVVKQIFFGEATYEDRSLTADATWDIKAKKLFLSVKMQTPPARELTPEEIGRNMKKASWIRLVETDKLGLVVAENGSFSGTLQGRVFIEDNGKATRQLMAMHVSGTIAPDNTIQLEATVGDVTPSRPLYLEPLGGGKYNVGISGGIALKVVSSQ